jgi:hypothetical protein
MLCESLSFVDIITHVWWLNYKVWMASSYLDLSYETHGTLTNTW